MKKMVFVWLCFFLIPFSYSQTLFTYGTHKVSATEFLDAYNKNKTDTVDNPQALRDYLALYINFKLKVQAAKDMQLDTLPSLIADLQNFRDQVKGNYLTDENEVNRLVNEAFLRSQKDIHTVYFFLKSDNIADSAKDKKLMNIVTEKLNSGHSDSEILLKVNLTTPGKIEKQDIGYITVFTLPYKFENIIYALKPGKASAPVSTKNGWYIFKNVGERNAVGKITVAQILFAVPEENGPQKNTAKKMADSVYHVLQQGGNFEILAKEYSDDRNTFMNGGLMPEFGTAKYNATFETQAFSLKKDGDISIPFETKFGFHILKRISAVPTPTSKADEANMHNLRQQVLDDSRNKIAREKFIREIIPVIGLKKQEVDKEQLWKFTDTALLKNKDINSEEVNKSTVLLTFNNDKKIRVGDWVLYLRNLNRNWGNEREKDYQQLFPGFINDFSIANYASRLENYNPAFKAQIDEFKEGNLLFEIMQRKVWGKASSDTVGLHQFYQQHHQKYLWYASADAIIFSCSTSELAKSIIAELKKGKSWREIVNDNPSTIQADSGRFELGQIPVVERTAFANGLITLPVINKNDGTAVFAKIIKMYPDNQQRTFEDARGLVINDYQNFLEQNWVDQLKKKYPVKVNEKLLQSLLTKN